MERGTFTKCVDSTISVKKRAFKSRKKVVEANIESVDWGGRGGKGIRLAEGGGEGA
jgi:hypothetical protein